jgi:hypothetical protein
MKTRLAAFAVAATLAFAARASAAPLWMSPEKSGPFMFNLQIGPAIGARNAINMGALTLDFGFALDSGRHAYLLFPLQFQFADVNVSVFGVGNDYTVGYIMVPIGSSTTSPFRRRRACTSRRASSAATWRRRRAAAAATRATPASSRPSSSSSW